MGRCLPSSPPPRLRFSLCFNRSKGVNGCENSISQRSQKIPEPRLKAKKILNVSSGKEKKMEEGMRWGIWGGIVEEGVR